MQDYERQFVERVGGLASPDNSFRIAAERGIRARLGEAPAEILLRSLSRAGRSDPRAFVKEASKIFGMGAISIYRAIESEMEKPRATEAPSAFESAVQELLGGINGSPAPE